MKRILAATVVALVCGGITGAATAEAAAQRPSLLSVDAAPFLLPATGGVVVVRARVQHARRCLFAGQTRAGEALGLFSTIACGGGHATARLTVRPNPNARTAALHFRVSALDQSGHRATRTVTITQAAGTASPPPPAPPAAPSVTIATTAVPQATVGVPYAASLIAVGGTQPYTWSLSAGALAPGLTLAPSGSIGGTPSSAGQWTFTATVSDAEGLNASATLAISVVVPASTTPTFASPNWSGYALIGGPFTAAKGTFNVPTIYTTPTDTATAEWVGLDGYSASDPTIIQAGVAEDYGAATNTYRVHAWVELFPAPPFDVPLSVLPGNQITITIAQASVGIWTVTLTNITTGQTYVTQQPYGGPAQSAEWIVEAPTLAANNSVETVGMFSPVTFTQLGVNPVVGSLTRFVMVQNGIAVSTPSPLSPNGFTVGYGGVSPAAP